MMPNSWSLKPLKMKISNLAMLFLTLALAQSTICRASEESEDEDSEIPLNIRATAGAWKAFRNNDYGEALEKADECIARYQPSADKMQAVLEAAKTTLPSGTVSEADQQRIYQYGILHDVATCLLIKGWIAEKQGKKAEAAKVYGEVKKYSYARVSEHPGEPYWSPAEVAAEQLKELSR